MKTSQQQFEMMLTFMEHHGDISNRVMSAKGRLNQLKLWEDLTALLNSESSGATKSSEKWKKVWSDYKSNTKKKAARLQRLAEGTGGGAAVFTKLTDLECRTIAITGIETATGLPVEEAGYKQVDRASGSQEEPDFTNDTSPPPECLDIEFMDEYYEVNGPSRNPTPAAYIQPQRHFNNNADDVDVIQREERSCRRRAPSPNSSGTDTRATTARPEVQPNLKGQTFRRRAGRGALPRAARQSTKIDLLSQQYLNSNAEWRQMQVQNQESDMEIRREANRIKILEIETQRVWQEMGNRALNLLEKVVDRYCKD